MNGAAVQQPAPPKQPDELDALLVAISDGIDALVAWDSTAFQSALDRQSAICLQICTRSAPAAGSAALSDTLISAPQYSSATARKVRELNRVYDRLLQHSIQWTRTQRFILQAGGLQLPCLPSIHFRG